MILTKFTLLLITDEDYLVNLFDFLTLLFLMIYKFSLFIYQNFICNSPFFSSQHETRMQHSLCLKYLKHQHVWTDDLADFSIFWKMKADNFGEQYQSLHDIYTKIHTKETSNFICFFRIPLISLLCKLVEHNSLFWMCPSDSAELYVCFIIITLQSSHKQWNGELQEIKKRKYMKRKTLLLLLGITY